MLCVFQRRCQVVALHLLLGQEAFDPAQLYGQRIVLALECLHLLDLDLDLLLHYLYHLLLLAFEVLVHRLGLLLRPRLPLRY